MELANYGINITTTVMTNIICKFIENIIPQTNNNRKILNDIKNNQLSNAVNEMIKCGYMSYTELFGFKNVIKIVEKAEKFYEQQNNNNDKQENQLNFDWFIRFYDLAKNISNEEFQILWAKVLASEIRKPGNVSYSLLHTLYMMESYQANVFKSIVRFSLFDGVKNLAHPLIFLSSNIKPYENSNITFEGLKELERLGLIECSFYKEYVFKGKKIFRYGNKEILIIGDSNNKDNIKAGNVKYTKNGQFLFSIVGLEYKEYVIEIIDFIIDKFKKRNCTIIINNQQII